MTHCRINKEFNKKICIVSCETFGQKISIIVR